MANSKATRLVSSWEFSEFTIAPIQALCRQFATDLRRGLSGEEAEKRLTQGGANELEAEGVHWLQIWLRQFASPFLYLLFGAVVVALLLGEYIDALMILSFVLLNSLLGFYQEFRSEHALAMLRSFVVKRARVMRDGKETLIAASEVVPGDVVTLETGDMVPADIRLCEETDFFVDESLLTGESAPVKKVGRSLDKRAQTVFAATNMAFSGTTVVGGKARGIVVATGRKTALGGIAHLTVETSRVSGFAIGIGRFSRFILYLILLTLVFVFVANVFLKGSRADIPGLLVFSIALAVSVVPEALPVVTTFSLSRGALLLAKRHVVVKRLSAIEDLGSIEVLCTDKTGTLTENQLSVADIHPFAKAPVLFLASLASPFLWEANRQPNNAFDLALRKALSPQERGSLREFRLVSEEPFDPARRRNSVLVRKGKTQMFVVRGAPEEIVKLCSFHSLQEQRAVLAWAAGAGFAGKRVIGVGYRALRGGQQVSHLSSLERDMKFAGLVSFIDPLKKSAAEAVSQAKRLGVAVKVLTGDSPEVAGAVAMQIGLTNSPLALVTGEGWEGMSLAERRRAVREQAVFARVTPVQKYAIIELLQEGNEVGFLGEGVNDAPALKLANVAIVVSGAADIAVDAADIVLLKKSLHVVVDGIQEGRKVFANTLKYIKATLASNFGNFYAVAIASLFIDFLPMLPLQILLVNLLSDFPMISISADTVDQGELKRPRSYNVREIALLATVLGAVSSVFDFLFFAMYYRISPATLHTNWFIASILTELVFLFSIRTRLPFYKARRPSAMVLWLSSFAGLATLLVPFTELGVRVFRFVRPRVADVTVILLVVGVYFVVSESVKLLYYRFAEREARG